MQGFWNLIGKVGQGGTQAFPYEIGEKIPGLDGRSIWSLHRGKKKVCFGKYIYDKSIIDTIRMNYWRDCNL